MIFTSATTSRIFTIVSKEEIILFMSWSGLRCRTCSAFSTSVKKELCSGTANVLFPRMGGGVSGLLTLSSAVVGFCRTGVIGI